MEIASEGICGVTDVPLSHETDAEAIAEDARIGSLYKCIGYRHQMMGTCTHAVLGACCQKAVGRLVKPEQDIYCKRVVRMRNLGCPSREATRSTPSAVTYYLSTT